MAKPASATTVAVGRAPDPGTSAVAAAWRSLRRHKGALVGAAILVAIVAMALFTPWISPYDPFQQIPWEARRGPLTYFEGSGRFVWLGTDHLGRDLLSRIIYASRVTLIVSLTAVVISGLIGVMLGVAAGYLGSWVDAICMRLVDIFLAFPFELLALSIVAVTGPSLSVVVVVMALRIWVVYARVVRGATLAVKEKDFVQAAVALGASELRVVFVHVLPNVLTPAIVIATLYVGRVILIESALSFLGIGVPASTPTWGGILGDGRSYIDTAWWIAFFPGLAIMITVLSVNLLGDWVRDHLDPRVQA
jgi:peptide/nickel transport system permease protein